MGADLHTKKAMELFNVEEKEVTKEMKKEAKIYNFLWKKHKRREDQ